MMSHRYIRRSGHSRKRFSVHGGAATALVGLSVALTVSGCRLPGKPDENAQESPRPEEVLSFDKLYGDNCAGCHGANGDHGAATNLANPGYQAWVDDTTLRDVIANGEKGTLMPAFSAKSGGNLTDQQVDVLIRGMRDAWGKATAIRGAIPPPYHASNAGNPANGPAVYAAVCARCHGKDGQHPGPAGSVLDGAFLALVNEQTIRTTIVPGRPDIGQPDWRNTIPGQPLTDAQVTDVAAWMVAQTPAHPGHPYPLTPNSQPTSERPGEQQPLAERNDTNPSNRRDRQAHGNPSQPGWQSPQPQK